MFYHTARTAEQRSAVSDQALPDAIPQGYARMRLAFGDLCGTDHHYYKDFASVASF